MTSGINIDSNQKPRYWVTYFANILLFMTIIVLYNVPQGRVAYWADWRLWGLTKSQWGNIHLNIRLLLLPSIFLHT